MKKEKKITLESSDYSWISLTLGDITRARSQWANPIGKSIGLYLVVDNDAIIFMS